MRRRTAKTEPSRSRRVPLSRTRYHAVQYDFYIPAAVCATAAVRTFVERLHTLDKGSTWVNGLVGDWDGQREITNIYRLIVRLGPGKTARGYRRVPEEIRAALDLAIDELMTELARSKATRQEAFLVTETDVVVGLTSLGTTPG